MTLLKIFFVLLFQALFFERIYKIKVLLNRYNLSFFEIYSTSMIEQFKKLDSKDENEMLKKEFKKLRNLAVIYALLSILSALYLLFV